MPAFNNLRTSEKIFMKFGMGVLLKFFDTFQASLKADNKWRTLSVKTYMRFDAHLKRNSVKYLSRERSFEQK
jgi:hypothetical protein